jgi:predicted acylesterase/phospholipase RssA
MDKFGKPFPFSIPQHFDEPTTLVLSGGAIKGTYILGALNGLKGSIKIDKFLTLVGISSGAIICFLLSIGYSPHEIFISILKNDNLLSVNLDNLRLSSNHKNYVVEKRGGIFSNSHIFDHVKTLAKLKKIPSSITFKEHFEKTKKRIVIMAFNLTERKEDIFTFDTTPDMTILTALKLSAGIPIIFKPLKYKNNSYVDGGVWNNFPVHIAVEYSKEDTNPPSTPGSEKRDEKRDERREPGRSQDSILAITTLHSMYKRTLSKWYTYKNIRIVMVDDIPSINPSLVCTDLEKYSMFVRGQQKGKMIESEIKKYTRRRRLSI